MQLKNAIPHRRRLRWVLLTFATGLLLATGCSNSESPGQPSGTSEPSVTTKPLDAEDIAAEVETTDSLEEFFHWEVLSSGAGGFVTGMDVDPAGEVLVARTDVGGAYRYDRSEEAWAPLLTFDSVEAPNPEDYFVASLVVAPSSPQRLYLAAGNSLDSPTGRILRSDDAGRSWTGEATGLFLAGNGNYRSGSERLAVDPSNPDEVWLATRTEGLKVSRDGGATFGVVDGVPAGPQDTQDRLGVSFVLAAADGTTVYAGVANVGVFVSHDDGGSWSSLYETPGLPVDAAIDANGRLWIVEDAPGALRIVDNDVVASMDAPYNGLRTLAVDPKNPDIAFVGAPGIAGGNLFRTADGGENWKSMTVVPSCPSVPWLDQYANDYLPTGSPLVDPIDGSLWIPEGFAIWRASEPAREQMPITCEVVGIEELVSTDVVIPAGGNPITAHWDRGIFYHDSTSAGDAVQGPTPRFNSAWDLDWSPADPSVVFSVVSDHRFCCEDDGGAYSSGFSTDGGRTWQPFESYGSGHPYDLRFGNIAVAADSVDNLVWLPSFNQAPHFSLDRGATWTEVKPPGTETLVNDDGSYAGGSHFQYFLNRKALVADRVAPGTFYLYHQENGLYVSADGGASWERQASTDLPVGWPFGFFNLTMVASPYETGHLFVGAGILSETVSGLHYSTDAGSSWSRAPAITGVTAIAVGAPSPDAGPATIYAAGTVGEQYGVWAASVDDWRWQLVSPAPNGNYQNIKALAAAADEYGVIYVGFEGTSFVVGRFAQ